MGSDMSVLTGDLGLATAHEGGCPMTLTIEGPPSGYELSDLREELDDLQRRVDCLRRGGVACRVIDGVQRNLDALRLELARCVDERGPQPPLTGPGAAAPVFLFPRFINFGDAAPVTVPEGEAPERSAAGRSSPPTRLAPRGT